MAVTEPERLALHAAARGALGPEEGDTLMASLPPANTDTGIHRDLTRAVDRFEANLRRHIWRVVVGTGVVLYIALTGTLAALMALLLLVVAR